MKERLDILLVQQNIVSSREKAKVLITSGNVIIEGKVETKPSKLFEQDVTIHVKENDTLKYVSRGGFKLEKALSVFPITLKDKVCMDIGASTGGFTDCMLQNGAAKVYAVDVGTNQLHESLASDPRVISMEQTNIRYLTSSELSQKISFASMDVSFISLTKILMSVKNLLEEKGEVVCLIKPQFEAGKDKLNKKGVVKDKSVHRGVLQEVLTYAIQCGFHVAGIDYSPIKGPEGNIEYLAYLKLDPFTSMEEGKTGSTDTEMFMNENSIHMHIQNIVNAAHGAL